MSDELDGGWGDVSEPPRNVNTETGEIGEIPVELDDAEDLVARIIGNPHALDSLKKALGMDKPKPDKLKVFATLEEFMDEYLLRTFRKHLTGSNLAWCEQWPEHPEARMALDALWDRWEEDRRSPGGVAHWLMYYGWPFMDRLTTQTTSPFNGCKHTTAHQEAGHHGDHMEVLPTAVFEEGLFPVHPTKANPNP